MLAPNDIRTFVISLQNLQKAVRVRVTKELGREPSLAANSLKQDYWRGGTKLLRTDAFPYGLDAFDIEDAYLHVKPGQRVDGVPICSTVLHTKSGKRPGTGNLGVFEGKEPWGPWKTVYYKRNWGAENGGPGEITGGLSCYFAPKFLSQDGKDFTLVFTDDDHWASVRGRFIVEASTK